MKKFAKVVFIYTVSALVITSVLADQEQKKEPGKVTKGILEKDPRKTAAFYKKWKQQQELKKKIAVYKKWKKQQEEEKKKKAAAKNDGQAKRPQQKEKKVEAKKKGGPVSGGWVAHGKDQQQHPDGQLEQVKMTRKEWLQQ